MMSRQCAFQIRFISNPFVYTHSDLLSRCSVSESIILLFIEWRAERQHRKKNSPNDAH